MHDSNSPIHWSASEIARRIARREISAAEVTRAFIARIEEVNPRLNAVVVPRFEDGDKEAVAADERQARGEPLGLLHGVPITLKECFHLAGTPSTIGLDSVQFRQPIERDGIAVVRLRRGGAIVLGKTNLPQLMIWHESDNPVYGRTNNPWDLARTCGGSTGGEAAIVAARGSPLGIGNDLGGSIRVPCHFCGIHGIRPTSLRMPRSGSARTLRGFEAFITQTGPMSRHVEDLWLALQVLTDQSDGYVASDVVPAPIGNPAEVRVDKLKIAAWTDDGVFPASPAVARAVREAAAGLRTCGAEVVELDTAEVERQFGASEAFDLYCSLIGADGGADARRLSRGSTLDHRVRRLLWIAGLPRPMRAVVVAGLKRTGQRWMARIVNHARPRSADGYWQLVERKNQLAARVLANMRQRGISAIICPPHALPAMPHVKAFDLLGAASYAMLINLLGLPSGTVATTRVSAGEDASRPKSRDTVLRRAKETDEGSVGLPVGVQVSSLPWREDIVLSGDGCFGKMGGRKARLSKELRYASRIIHITALLQSESRFHSIVRLSFNNDSEARSNQNLRAMPDTFPLQMLPAGQRARIDQLVGRPDEVHRLQELGMHVGTPVEVLQSGSTCIVKLDGTRLAFRDHEGFHVLVRLGEAG